MASPNGSTTPACPWLTSACLKRVWIVEAGHPHRSRNKWSCCAAIMSLLHTARLNGLEPYAYLKDVLDRLPTQPASAMTELLPYRWSAAI